jgi:hypothetical protein
MHMRVWSLMLVTAVGCAAPALDDGPDALEADLGGPSGLMEFLSTSDAESIRDTLAAYGVGYELHATDDKNIADCPQYFPSSDRNKYHSFDGEHYYIDGSGRPQRAYKYLPPVAAASRNQTCQSNVGRWGDAENPSNDYDGGHMIGAQLGGWGARANLVPQDANFNQGNWNQVEGAMAKCRVLPSNRMFYQVILGYANGSTLIPNSWRLYMEDRVQLDNITLNFTNTDLGGSSGNSERTRGINYLSAQGCN